MAYFGTVKGSFRVG